MARSGIKRLECLDGLRGILATYVLLGHLAPFALLPIFVQVGLSHGEAAVDVFFMLSGLVITQSLLHAEANAKRFLIVRAARIYPVFLLVFGFAVAIDWSSCGFERMPWISPDNAARKICTGTGAHAWLAEITAHLTMTHGLFPKEILPDVWVSLLGAAWSLSTEWQFYVTSLLMLVGCRWLQRLSGPSGADRSSSDVRLHLQALCFLLLGLAAAGVVWRMWAPEAWQFSRAFLPNKGHTFALGVASMFVVRGDRGALWRYALVLAACLAISSTQGVIGKLLPPLVWTLCLAVQLQPARGMSLLPGWLLRHPVMQYLGAISYCLYLVNEPIHKVIAVVLSRLAHGDAILFTLVWLPTAAGLPVLVSMWLHAHVEAPALRWGRSFARQVSPPVVTECRAL